MVFFHIYGNVLQVTLDGIHVDQTCQMHGIVYTGHGIWICCTKCCQAQLKTEDYHVKPFYAGSSGLY